MKTNKQNIILYIISIIFLGFLTNCQKQEFLPEPIGKEVPEKDAPSLTDIIKTEASLFYIAWEKAGMDKILKSDYPQTQFTYLIPSNEAMEKAGYSEMKIKGLDIEKLQEIIRFHIIDQKIDENNLVSANLDIACRTLLKHNKVYNSDRAFGAQNVIIPYFYKHYISFKNKSLIINGKERNYLKQIDTKQGSTWIINHVLKIFDTQMLDVLKQDKRFSLYIKAIEYSMPNYFKEIKTNLFYQFKLPIQFQLDFFYIFPGSVFESQSYKRDLIYLTLFAPTNEAFNHIGIFNEDDLIKLYKRVPVPDYYGESASSPIDSLLANHNFSRIDNSLFFNNNNLGIEIVGTQGYVHYSTAFDNPNFKKLILRTRGQSPYVFYPDFSFNKKDGKYFVSHKNSNVNDVNIIESDINSLQGPIHVVNRILVPKGFTMWHLKK